MKLKINLCIIICLIGNEISAQWTALNGSTPSAINKLATYAGNVYAATPSNGVWRYSAGNWTSFNNGALSASASVQDITITSNGWFYIVSNGDIYYRSAGGSWTLSANFPVTISSASCVYSISISGGLKTIYAGSDWGGFGRCAAGTDSWVFLDQGTNGVYPSLAINSFNSFFVNGHYDLYIASESGFYTRNVGADGASGSANITNNNLPAGATRCRTVAVTNDGCLRTYCSVAGLGTGMSANKTTRIFRRGWGVCTPASWTNIWTSNYTFFEYINDISNCDLSTDKIIIGLTEDITSPGHLTLEYDLGVISATDEAFPIPTTTQVTDLRTDGATMYAGTSSGVGYSITCSVLRTDFSGLNQSIENKIKIFPTVANDKLQIELTGLNRSALLNVFSIAGQKVKEVELTELSTILDVSDLSLGLYFVSIRSDEINESRKIQITR